MSETTPETTAEIVAKVAARVTYPRFLGEDDAGDFVWELADGRWTWGDTPHDAFTRARRFEPDRYVDKFGEPTTMQEVKR
jgi:hypothetical protein